MQQTSKTLINCKDIKSTATVSKQLSLDLFDTNMIVCFPLGSGSWGDCVHCRIYERFSNCNSTESTFFGLT